MTDLATKSLELLNSYGHEILNNMTEKEYIEYIEMSNMLGSKYMYYGKRKGIAIEKYQNYFMFFGTTMKQLVFKD